MFRDESCVRVDVSRAVITSNINRARYPQSLVRTLTGEEVSHLLAFDYCSLVLPDSDGRGIRIWRAAHMSATQHREAAVDDSLDLAQTLLARLLDDGSSKLIDETDLHENAAREFGDDVKSALALPLAVGGKCFGLLCFASTQPNAYKKEDTERLMWLADHVLVSCGVITGRDEKAAAVWPALNGVYTSWPLMASENASWERRHPCLHERPEGRCPQSPTLTKSKLIARKVCQFPEKNGRDVSGD